MSIGDNTHVKAVSIQKFVRNAPHRILYKNGVHPDEGVLDRIEACFSLCDLKDHSMENGIRDKAGRCQSYDKRLQDYDDILAKHLDAKQRTEGVMYSLHLSKVWNQALTTHEESNGRRKLVLLPMTHMVDKYRNTSTKSELFERMKHIQHVECVMMKHRVDWKSTTHIGQDKIIHKAFKFIQPLVDAIAITGKDDYDMVVSDFLQMTWTRKHVS